MQPAANVPVEQHNYVLQFVQQGAYEYSDDEYDDDEYVDDEEENTPADWVATATAATIEAAHTAWHELHGNTQIDATWMTGWMEAHAAEAIAAWMHEHAAEVVGGIIDAANEAAVAAVNAGGVWQVWNNDIDRSKCEGKVVNEQRCK